jgi:hypothetical protein
MHIFWMIKKCNVMICKQSLIINFFLHQLFDCSNVDHIQMLSNVVMNVLFLAFHFQKESPNCWFSLQLDPIPHLVLQF